MTKPKRDWKKIKYYPVSIEKLMKASMREAAYLIAPMNIGEDYEYFDKVKHLLDIPEPPKTLDEITQELDEKIDALIKTTKEKFECSNYFAGKKYNEKFDRIIQDFEYARKNGSFPPKLTFTIGDGLYGNNYVTSNFVIKSNSVGVGYWDVKPNIQMWLQEKPNWLVRKCAKIFFDFGWKDA